MQRLQKTYNYDTIMKEAGCTCASGHFYICSEMLEFQNVCRLDAGSLRRLGKWHQSKMLSVES